MSNPIFYNPNTPTIPLSFADWQLAFLPNFQQLFAAFSENHIPLDGGSTAGNHTVVEMPEQATGQQTDTAEIAMYSKDVPGQTDQMILRLPNNGQEIQYTNYQIYSLPNTPNSYFTFLPGKIIVYFGIIGVSTNPIIVSLNPQVARNVITVNVTPINVSNTLGISVAFGADSTSGIIQRMFLSVPSPAPTSNYSYLVMANL